MKKCLAVSVVVLTFLVAAPRAIPSDDEAQAAANAMVDRFVDSWNRADGAAYAQNYWPEAELVDPMGWGFQRKSHIGASTPNSKVGLEIYGRGF